MITVRDSIIIERPVSEVFPMLADPANHLKWDKGNIKSIDRLNNGPIGVGSKFIFRVANEELEIEYSEYEPDRHLIQHFKLKYGEGRHKFELVEIPEGTRFHQEISIKPKGMFRMFRSVIQTELQKNIQSIGIRVKQYLENGETVSQ